MVNGVFPAPVVIRCQGQNSGNCAQEMVGLRRTEKRAVAAIMKDNKGAHQDCAGEHRQWHSEPPGNQPGKIHQAPKAGIRNKGVNELPNRPSGGWLLVARNYLFPRGCARAAFALNAIRIFNHKLTKKYLAPLRMAKKRRTKSWKVTRRLYSTFAELQADRARPESLEKVEARFSPDLECVELDVSSDPV